MNKRSTRNGYQNREKERANIHEKANNAKLIRRYNLLNSSGMWRIRKTQHRQRNCWRMLEEWKTGIYKQSIIQILVACNRFSFFFLFLAGKQIKLKHKNTPKLWLYTSVWNVYNGAPLEYKMGVLFMNCPINDLWNESPIKFNNVSVGMNFESKKDNKKSCKIAIWCTL